MQDWKLTGQTYNKPVQVWQQKDGNSKGERTSRSWICNNTKKNDEENKENNIMIARGAYHIHRKQYFTITYSMYERPPSCWVHTGNEIRWYINMCRENWTWHWGLECSLTLHAFYPHWMQCNLFWTYLMKMYTCIFPYIILRLYVYIKHTTVVWSYSKNFSSFSLWTRKAGKPSNSCSIP